MRIRAGARSMKSRGQVNRQGQRWSLSAPERSPFAFVSCGDSKRFVVGTTCVALFALGLAPTWAQDATWVGPTSDWNTDSNWSPGAVPTGVATFAGATPTSITFSAPLTSVGMLGDKGLKQSLSEISADLLDRIADKVDKRGRGIGLETSAEK